MPGTYQIVAVAEDQDGIHVTVEFTDSVKPGVIRKVYTFAATPVASQLESMMKAERVIVFRLQGGPGALPAPGPPVNVPVDPVLP